MRSEGAPARHKRNCTHRVPDLELHRLVVDADHARAKLDANCEVVHGLRERRGERQEKWRMNTARLLRAINNTIAA